MVNKIEYIKDSDMLFQGTEKINKFAIDPANRAEENSVKANVKSEDAIVSANKANENSIETQRQLDSIVLENGNSEPEVVQARGKNNLLYQRFENVEGDISAIALNVLNFDVLGDGTTDDTEAINRLLNNCPENAKILFPEGIYKVSSNIIVSRKLNLIGVKPLYDANSKLLKDGSIISGGGIYFKTGSSGSTLDGLGIYTLASANGIDVHGLIDDLNISNIVSKARDHAFLIESYDGLVSNVTISNCESHDGIHGFIVKATKAIVENCSANNHNSWGIGIISDNIGSANNKGFAIDNKVINCKSVKCGAGFIQYCRDYYSHTLENGVLCEGNQFSSVTAIDCGIGLTIGDVVGDTGGGKYTSTYVTRTLVNGFTERNSTAKSVVLRNSKNCSISNTIIEKGMEISPADANQGLSINNNVGMKAGGFYDIQLLDKSEAPYVGFGNLFRTANTESTVIKEFVGAVDGKRFKVNLWDNLTKIIGNSKIYLTNGEFSGVGNSIEFIFQDGIYFEISRYQASPTVRSVNYVQNAANLSISGTTLIDLYGSGTTDVQVKPVNFNPAGQEINIFIRSSSGNFTFGGFDSNLFVTPDNMQRTLNFGLGLMTKWAFVPNLNKFILINQELSKYA